jgi:hypothetical protein
MPNLPATVQKLGLAQAAFLAAADAVDGPQWNFPPSLRAWSAAQLVAHLCQVERGVLGYADRVIRKTPLPVSRIRRFHLPMALIESRLIKRKSPIPVEPELRGSKESMLAELRGVRERTLAFLEETHGRDLSVYCWPHPFLGRLDFYGWFTFVAAHQIRHTKQMVEISQNIPNRVVSSQK